MPRRKPIDRAALESFAPHGVIARRELLSHGMPERTISNLVQVGGPWTRLLPGVYLMRSGTPTARQRAAGALCYAGDRAMITGLCAARLFGLAREPDTRAVHVLVPDKAQPNSYGYVIVERTKRLPAPKSRDGLAVAPVVRAVLDGARRLRDPAQVQALLAETVQRGFASPAELLAELNAGTTRGSAVPRRMLREIQCGVRSPAEGNGFRLVRRTGLPAPNWNVPVVGPDGELLAVVDAWFDEVAMAWEIDSYEYHLSPQDYARTLRRHNALTAAGVVVVHTLPSDIQRRPHDVIARLQAAYRHAAARPRPAIGVRRAA